jgi:polysaccharide biosynthesis/export protein
MPSNKMAVARNILGRSNALFRILNRPRPLVGSLILALFATLWQVAAQQPSPDTGPLPKNVPPPAAQIASPGLQADQTYRLGSGDVVEIRVFNRPQLTRDAVRIDERGMIRMPLIDDELRASCRTGSELARDITIRYRKYLRNPQVDVFVKEYQSQPVAVVGAVNAPGRFQLRRPVRLMELLTFAGGPSEKGGKQVQVVHASGVASCESQAGASGEETAASFEAFSLRDIFHGDGTANPYVRPGDVITVPEAEQAFVVGNVVRPTTIALKETTTVTQAIAMAGGTMPDTKTDRVRIVRQTGAIKKEIFVDLKAIASRRSEDVALQANDIVEVPTSSGKRFLRTLTSAIMPAAARFPVRVIP